MKVGNNITKWVLLTCILAVLVVQPVLGQGSTSVHVIKVHDTIEGGLAAYIERAYEQAEGEGAEFVILELDTPGGLVESAKEIRRTIEDSPIESIAYVRGEAISAGVLIALSAERIYMAPGSTIGDAEPRVGGETADEKIVSYWASLLASAAEQNGRDGQIARAMADRDTEIPGIVAKGKLLTLTDKEALEMGFSDGKASSINEVLVREGIENAETVEVPLSASEKLIRLATNPYIAPLLLALGFAGLAVELVTMGFGVAGIIGMTALGIYFWGHFVGGMGSLGAILLFLTGIVLIIVEAFVIPGFGVAGAAGLAALVAGIVLTAGSITQGLISLVVALAVAAAAILLSFKFGRTRKVWEKLILSVSMDKQSGYSAPSVSLQQYLGREGTALTTLRPSGTVEVDGERLDVVAEGSYIAKDTPVRIIKVEGARVVVRQIDQKKGE